ncbi:N-acetylmuramoyl-L-alanine amidase [Enterocloster clostridioformis]
MEQRRRQPVWRAEGRRKREKRIARLRRRIIAYTVRGIVAAVLAVMLLLMVCGCLYLWDFFRRNNKDTALKADSVREAVPATVPAVLVEAGYLSNYNERNQLMSGEYQGKLAQGLVEGIVEGLEGKAG